MYGVASSDTGSKTDRKSLPDITVNWVRVVSVKKQEGEAMENRPSGRQKHVTEGGKGVQKQGQGLGGGPVGRADGYAGRKAQKQASGAGRGTGGGQGGAGSPGGGINRGGSGGRSPLGIIILLAIVLLGGGGGISALLG